VEHRSIAKDKGQSLGLISLGEIDPEFCCRIHDSLLNGWVNTIISIQDSRNSRNADLSSFRDLSKSHFGDWKNFIFHRFVRKKRGTNFEGSSRAGGSTQITMPDSENFLNRWE